jgi:hypothetical protein
MGSLFLPLKKITVAQTVLQCAFLPDVAAPQSTLGLWWNQEEAGGAGRLCAQDTES